jgi:hypothetical protein
MDATTDVRRRAGVDTAPRYSALGLAAVVLVMILSGGVAPAAAAPGAGAAAEPAEGAGSVTIGVTIAPRDPCAGVHPPCKCSGGAPTLPPGLVKKDGPPGGTVKPGQPGKPVEPGKPTHDRCGSRPSPTP